MAISDEQKAAAWLTPHDQASRNILIQSYLPIVRYTASAVAKNLPQHVDVDDLAQAGIFGLVQAIRVFDPERGVKFETFCVWKIRGAMLDELRNADWVPRSVRQKAKRITAAIARFERLNDRKPNDEEIAALLEITKPQLANWTAETENVIKLESLSKVKAAGSDQPRPRDLHLGDLIADDRAPRPLDRSQRRDALRLVTKSLNQNERLIIILYYYEEMTMKEIGRTLELSESRVSQMHSAIIERLKRQLAGRRDELAA